MNEERETFDWTEARGRKWSAQLSGMDATLRPVDAPLIAALQLDEPSRIADVGCGGGATTLEILRRAPPGSVVHGFDIAHSLLERARARMPADGHAIRFELADMSSAAPAEPYDRLVSRFGVMFFDDPPRAFVNLRRWLRPGGRFAFAVWGPPAQNPWMTSVREVVARLVDVPPASPDAPGPFRYADSAMFVGALERASFTDVDVREWRGALPIGGGLGPTEAASFALASFASFAELLADAGPEALDDARRRSAERFSRHRRDDGTVWMDACVRIVTGSRR